MESAWGSMASTRPGHEYVPLGAVCNVPSVDGEIMSITLSSGVPITKSFGLTDGGARNLGIYVATLPINTTPGLVRCLLSQSLLFGELCSQSRLLLLTLDIPHIHCHPTNSGTPQYFSMTSPIFKSDKPYVLRNKLASDENGYHVVLTTPKGSFTDGEAVSANAPNKDKYYDKVLFLFGYSLMTW